MRVFVAGARGFIGRHVCHALERRGHEVIAGGRPKLDFSLPADWASLLAGAHVVVNAVGIIRQHGTQTFDALHDRGARALFDACEAAGVRRIVQVSALGADAGAASRFHLSKRRADTDLAARKMDWAIVQPSLVFGPGGESARLFLMLAALPVIPLPGEGTQPIQPVHIDDVTSLIVALVEAPGTLRQIVAAVGPRPLTLREYLAMLRAQMDLRSARFLSVPMPLVPLDRETLGMLNRGNTAAPDSITTWLGHPPRRPEDFSDAGMATSAKLAWLLPLLRVSLAIVWIVSGVVSLGIYPLGDSYAMLARVGLTGAVAALALYGSALLDIVLGVATLALRRRRWLWRAQMALIAAYSLIIALALPELWLHPFGPVLKNLPMLAAIVALHELEA